MQIVVVDVFDCFDPKAVVRNGHDGMRLLFSFRTYYFEPTR